MDAPRAAPAAESQLPSHERSTQPPAQRLTPVAVALVPALIAQAILIFFGIADGGYEATVWYPGSLLLLLLFGVTAAAYPRLLVPRARETVLSLAFFAAFGAWTYLSIIWADVRGDAWDGANRTLLYLVVFGLFALLPWRTRGAAIALGVFALAVTIVAAVSFLRVAAADDPSGFFIGGRLAEPVGYSNANCAFLLIAFWPAVVLSLRKETPLLLRGVFLAAAGLLLELALLHQSRGALFAFPLVALVALLAIPGRLRSALALIATIGTAALVHEPLLDVFAAAEGEGGHEALVEARSAVLVSVAALFAAGILAGLFDRAVHLSAPTVSRVNRIAAVAGVLAAIGLAAGLVAQYGDPFERAQNAWAEFKAGQPETFGPNRLTTLGSNRYDFWRVGLLAFRDDPVVGVGADNFAVDYVRERESDEEPRYPHSLEIQVLSQTGVIGAALLAGALASALLAAWRGVGSHRPFGRVVVAAALIAFAYWFAHGSVDWFWEIPALGAAAFMFLGLAVGMNRSPVEAEAPVRTRRLALGGSAIVGLVAAASLVLPWLAARSVAQASEGWQDDPAGAYARLERARALNPLSEHPDLVAGAIALRLDDLPRARAAFTRALERNDKSWYAYLELAVVAALEGKPRDALEYLGRADALDPREPVIDLVANQVRAGQPVDPDEIDRIFIERVEERVD